MVKDNHVFAFDGMRACAIIFVVLHHLDIDKRIPFTSDLFRYAALGCFIFISGYLIASRDVIVNSFGTGASFLYKRLVRILPLYWIAIVVFLFTFPHIKTSMTLFSYGAHALGLQLVFFKLPYCDPMLTLWYVGLIVPYYLFFAIFTYLKQHTYKSIGGYCAIVLFPVFLVMLRMVGGFSDKRLILYFAIFCLGIFTYRFLLLRFISTKNIIVAVLILIGSGYIYSTFLYPPTILADVQPPLFSAISLGAFVFTNIFMISFVIIAYQFFSLKALSFFKKPITFVAYASYGIFLFHRPLLVVLDSLMPSGASVGFKQVVSVCFLPVIIGVGWIIQKSYDVVLAKVKVG